MSYRLILLEDSLEPWLVQEPDRDRRVAVMDWLATLSEAEGHMPLAKPIAGTHLPAFADVATGTGVNFVWIVVDLHKEIAVRWLVDVWEGKRYGG